MGEETVQPRPLVDLVASTTGREIHLDKFAERGHGEARRAQKRG